MAHQQNLASHSGDRSILLSALVSTCSTCFIPCGCSTPHLDQHLDTPWHTLPKGSGSSGEIGGRSSMLGVMLPNNLNSLQAWFGR
jgi:hypothetical protein